MTPSIFLRNPLMEIDLKSILVRPFNFPQYCAMSPLRNSDYYSGIRASCEYHSVLKA